MYLRKWKRLYAGNSKTNESPGLLFISDVRSRSTLRFALVGFNGKLKLVGSRGRAGRGRRAGLPGLGSRLLGLGRVLRRKSPTAPQYIIALRDFGSQHCLVCPHLRTHKATNSFFVFCCRSAFADLQTTYFYFVFCCLSALADLQVLY